jgi:RHS repeat-associated protein
MSGGVATKAFHYTYDNADNRLTEQAGTTSRGFNAFSGSLNQLNSQTAGGPLRVSGAVSAVSTVTVNGQNATPLGAATVFSTDLANPPPGNLGLTVVATTAGAGSNSATATYHVNVGSGGSRTFSYDSNGNLMSDGIRSYTWDGADRLVTIFQSGNTTTFVYDGLGRRVREKLNGTVIKQWIWAGTELVEERDGSNAVTRRFYPQGEEINGVPYYYTRDHLGSVREMTDAAGNIRARYDYDPYGQTTKIAGDLEASFGFAGYYRHPGSGLYLTLYRAYDPNLARWLSRDPIGEDGGINLYAYVGNNPVNDVDPLGLYGVLGLEFDDGKSFLGNVGDYLGSASAGAGKGAAAYADGINPFGDPFQNARVYDPCKDSGTSSSKWLGKYVGREALATASGLRAAAFAGKLGRGTSWGSWINSNRYLRVGPGNLPKPKGAAAKFFGKGAGQNVPVLRIGNGKPAWYNHWDLRIWGGL